MTREEQLKFCQVCTHRQMDMRQGLLCELTHAKADFDTDCANYPQDEKAIEKDIGVWQERHSYRMWSRQPHPKMV